MLCVIFGIYEKLLDSILNFFKDVKKNFLFLLPIVIGAFIGVLLFSKLLNYFLNNYPIQSKGIFIGFILGSIPSLLKDVKSKSYFKFRYIFFTIFTFILGILTVVLEKNFTFSSIANNNINFIYLMISGFIMSVGIVVPGVSSTIILMLLGIYTTYISSVSNLFLPVLIPMGFGLILGCLIFMKITKYFLENYYAQTFYSIIGFTLGSIFVLLPSINTSLELLLLILCIIFSYNLAHWLTSS